VAWVSRLFTMTIHEKHSFCDNPPRKIPYYRLRPIHFGQ
jgi:hypothetical protein